MGIKDLAGLSEPITKLIEVIGCGIGKFLEAGHIKRNAKAEAYKIETISNPILNSNIPIIYDDGKVQINSTDFDELVKRTGSRLAFQEIQKQQNIESVIVKTYAELENEPPVSDEPVDPDWILRFFNSIEDISNDDMQTVWAKILAGEIKQPKSVSLRTLDVVKNLSPDEAKQFEEICKLGFENNFPITWQLSIMKSIESSQDCGLIQPVNVLNSFNEERNTLVTLFNRTYCIVLTKTTHSNRFSVIKNATLTKAGKELFKMLDIPFDYEYCCDYLKKLNTIKDSFKLSLHKIDSINNYTGKIQYNEKDLLL